jgi:Zn-dependent protease with chaperone function
VILAFIPRILCLSLASFFLVHLVLGLLTRILTPWSIRAAERFRAYSAARFLLAVRFLAPASALFVALWTVPTYSWMERVARAERVGFWCLGAALLGIFCLLVPMARGLTSVIRMLRYFRRCQRAGRFVRLPGERLPALVIEGSFPFFAVAGIFRPHLVVSAPILSALSAEQLAAAIRHERAHRLALDNLKRLAVLLAPDLLPFFGGFTALESAWMRFAEWAADDRVAAGNPRRSVSLAAALVRIAGLGLCQEPPALMTPLLTDGQDLALRVNRLLDAAPLTARRRRRPMLTAFLALSLGGALSVAAAQPVALRSLGGALERLHRAGLSGKKRTKGNRRKRAAGASAMPAKPGAVQAQR